MYFMQILCTGYTYCCSIPEIPITLERLTVFYKQKEMCLYPAWAYVIPATILKVPLSLVESLVWTCLTYYVIGFSPEIWRWVSFEKAFCLFLHWILCRNHCAETLKIDQFLCFQVLSPYHSTFCSAFYIIIYVPIFGINFPKYWLLYDSWRFCNIVHPIIWWLHYPTM